MGAGAIVALKAVGTGLQMWGQITATMAQADRFTYDARSAERMANDVRRQGNYQHWMMAVRMGEVIGSQRAAFGNAGVAMRGTALDVMAKSLRNMTADRMMAKYNAERKERELRVAAKAYRKAASRTKRAGVLGAIGSGITSMTRKDT